MGQFFF